MFIVLNVTAKMACNSHSGSKRYGIRWIENAISCGFCAYCEHGISSV